MDMSAGFGPPHARLVSAGLVLAVCSGGTPVWAQGEPRMTSPASHQASTRAGGVRLRAIQADPRSGRAAAVVVEEGALVHSALLYPLDAQSRLQGAGDAYAQATYVLGSLDTAVRAAGKAVHSRGRREPV